MKLGDPPSIEFRSPCPKCGVVKGFRWTYGENNGKSNGYSTCLACGAELKND